ncbi:MAG: DUF1800 domain-containing protein [Anaerolineales bacterium]|nr:DUF1800 domain-containing protein [Anaerolineales bacterium]
MSLTRRDFLGFATGRFAPALAQPAGPKASADDPILHLLNRISWGPLPDELAHARAIGAAAYLDEQLNPEGIDDSAAEARLRQRTPLWYVDRRDIYRLASGEWRAYEDLTYGTIFRAVYSKRQLLERMVDFWSDHFNVSSDQAAVERLEMQRQVIIPHALGNFKDLLVGTAKSPAMLYYLDNYVNYAEAPNENYARELMELHTLGVDGGYTEEDVREVARAFTGWTVHEGSRTGFYFDPNNHDGESKWVLGHRLPAGRGIEDGFHVLQILAQHPATAQFLSRKLCVRFVSDNPPQALVDSTAAVWRDTGGEIRPVLRHLFLSPEFAAAQGQKFRRPLEFLIGALRATGTELVDDWVLEQMVAATGQVPFNWHPPNGYPDVAGAWQSTNGLLARWNIAMQLTHGAWSDHDDTGWGLLSHLRDQIGNPATVGELVDETAAGIFGTQLSGANRDAFIRFTADDGPADTPVDAHLLARKYGSLFGLMLASPLYQWR